MHTRILVTLVASVGLAGIASADTFWGAGCPSTWGGSSPAIFQLDTATGVVGDTYVYESWSWLTGLAYGDGALYAVHNTVDDGYTMKIAKVDPATGAVLSDTAIPPLTSTDYPQPNTLHYQDGKLYAIENNTWGDGYSAGAQRGNVYEFTLDASGDPVSAQLGAHAGDVPDGALTSRDGVWYASDWLTGTSSSIMTSTDIMNTDFTSAGATQGTGYFSGWDFEAAGALLGVSWYAGFDVYEIDLTDGSLTTRYNIGSQLPLTVEQLTALTVPEPTSLLLLLLAGIAALRRR